MTEMKGLGSLSKRGSRLLFEEVCEMPEAFDARFRKGGRHSHWGLVARLNPESFRDVLPGPSELRVEVVAGVILWLTRV